MAAKPLATPLANYLLSNNLISEEQLKLLADKQKKSGKSWEETLLDEKIFTSADFALIKGKAFNLPVAELGDTEINSKVLNLLPQNVSENYQMVIFARQGRIISVGLVNPDDFLAHGAVEFLAKEQDLEPKYYAISLADFRKAFKQYSAIRKELGSAIKSAEEKFAAKGLLLEETGTRGTAETIKAAPVAKIVSVIITNAVEGGASDIHIEPGRAESRVRYRVDGILHTSLLLPNYILSAVVSRIKVLSNLKLDETRVPQDGRISVATEGRQVDLRVSILPMLNAEKVVIRVLDTSAGVPTLAQLGFLPHHIEVINRNIKKSYGMFLLTGPTGSGKTTTLYSILNLLDRENTNITTLEDPIEYYMDGINQSQVNPDVGFTFASGLRAILRQDPNIIMVGEIRDNETVELCIHAGLTGHLVFSTLHTNDAWGAIPRLIDMKAEPFLLSSTINLVMAQRLVRKICQQCKKEIQLPPALAAEVKSQLDAIPRPYLEKLSPERKFYRGEGCQDCANTGYNGRTVISEILEFGPELKNLIAKGVSQADVSAQLKKQNYISVMQDGLLKALSGQTSIEEVLRVTQA